MLPFFYLFIIGMSILRLAEGSCGHPGMPKYGGLTTASKEYYTEGDIVFYRCNPPFILYGSKIRKCQGNGSWSEEVPLCLTRAGNVQARRLPLEYLDGNVITCANYKNLQFSNITVSPTDRTYLIAVEIVYGSGRAFTSPLTACEGKSYEITFTITDEGIQLKVCESQYAVNLLDYFICEIEILAFKGAKDCGTPDSPANAEKVFLSEVNGKVISKTTCAQDRFVLVGNDTKFCDDFGKWSGERQYCKALYCEDLLEYEKDPEMHLSYEPPLGANKLPAISTRAMYTCSEGFVLNESERKCFRNGTWSGKNPICIPDVSYWKTWKVIGIAAISTLSFMLLALIGYLILLFFRNHSKTNKQRIPSSSPISDLNPNNARVRRDTRTGSTFTNHAYYYISHPNGNDRDLYDDVASSLPDDSSRQSVVDGFDSSKAPFGSNMIVIECCPKNQMDLQPASSRKSEYENCSYTPEQHYVEIIE